MIYEGKEREDTSKQPLINELREVKEEKKIGFDYDLYRGSNCISKLFFYWALRVLKLASITPLKLKDLGTIEGENDSKNFIQHLNFFWEGKKYKNKKSNALFKTLMRANLCRIVALLFFSVIISALEFLCVMIIKYYIDYFQYPEDRPFDLITLGVSFITARILSTFFFRQLQMYQVLLAGKSSLELVCFIYDKVLRASPSSYGEKSNQGDIINYIQVDSSKMYNAVALSPLILITPIQIVVYIYLLFRYFGISFLYGMIVLAIFMLFNYKIFASYRILFKEMLERKDKRMKITTETFDSLKLLKLYNWENEFKQRILDARLEEAATAKKILNITTFNIAFYWAAPVLSSIVTIGVYQYLYTSLNIGNILIGLTIFNMLQPAIRELPVTINSLLEAVVSMGRIEKFLRQDEVDPTILQEGKIDDNVAIKIVNGTFSWGADPIDPLKPASNNPPKIENSSLNSNPPEQTDFRINSNESVENPSMASVIQENKGRILKGINLEIKKGETIGIIGEVSSGKSSLLQAILNNLILEKNEHMESSIFLNGSIAYVSQVPWIQNDTIRNNIVFFKDYIPEKYHKVIDICQLKHDIESLEAGDNTEIGEKGINLSGGQKSRVALARAVYSQSDIYLLDDPISALDAHVGKKIIKDCILKHLRGSTVVLVTHALQYLKHLDRIVYLSQGEVKWTGTYEELKKAEFFQEISAKLHHEKEEEHKDLLKEEDENHTEEIKMVKKDDQIKRITLDEEQNIGEVKIAVYLKYFEYMGGIISLVMITLIMFLWQLNKAGSDYWLAYWSQKENQERDEKWLFFGIYATLGLASSIFIFFRIFLLSRGTLHLAIKLHKDMIEKLVKAPINLFHDSIPRGQIYNRLSKDLENVFYTMFYYGGFFVSFFSAIGSIVICSIFEPYSLIFIPVFCFFGYFLTKFYLKGSRDLSRLEGITRSPLLNTLSETISGSITIRAYKFQQHYLNKFYSKVNDVFKVSLLINGTSNWFGMHMDFVSLSFITFITVIIIVFENEFTPQSVGLMLTYAFQLKDRLFELFKTSADFENLMVAMERCLQYTTLEEEKGFSTEKDETLLQQNWPAEGKIEFVDYSVKYRPTTETVLNNLNFVINPKEKIGIVGRTGSGKSTICLCLFRILEPMTGTIKIDDVDITQIGLNLLRQKLTIIPQDPSLMKGTLKYNIDPFDKYSEEEISRVLSVIGFSSILTHESGLERMIAESGENLSVGEKQLICIARAILRKSKIVIMDEATANIDIKTEEVIQNAIHNLFKDTTIITIAHRIKTILTYDRILVLQDGKVMEFDTPQNLINDKSSMFYELYSKSSL